MRFSKAQYKLTLCAGATSKQAKSGSVQKQAHPVKRIHFTDVKPLRQFLMISSKFLFKRISKMGSKMRSQPLQQFDSQGLPEDYQVGYGFLTKLQKAGTFVQ